MRFEEKLAVVKLPVSGTGIGDIPLEHTEEIESVGWSVILLIGGKQNGIDFPAIEPAMACYNAIMNMIEAVGVPMASGSRLRPPEPAPTILDADGKAREAVKAAVDAADIKAAADLIEAGEIEAGEAGEDLLDPVIDDEPPILSDEELEALTAPDEDQK
jgi:hypothetical protein